MRYAIVFFPETPSQRAVNNIWLLRQVHFKHFKRMSGVFFNHASAYSWQRIIFKLCQPAFATQQGAEDDIAARLVSHFADDGSFRIACVMQCLDGFRSCFFGEHGNNPSL
jgi:hypothetical protein